MDGDKVHATVDFHHVSIVEDRHAFPHMFLRNTVMVLEQRYVGVPVKEDENYSFSAHYGGATTFNQARSFGLNIRPVADR